MAATKIPDALSDDLNYETWAPIVKSRLVEKGLWDVVENGVPPDPSKIPELAATIQPDELSKWRDLAVKDMKALQILQSSLTDSAFRKTLSASSAKDVWDSLKKGKDVGQMLKDSFESKSKQRRGGEVEDEHVLSSLMVADFKIEEDMWMIHTVTTNHMTPHLKFFTTLDTTYRARVKFAYVGSSTMAQGRGDVKIMTKEGVKTIKNVLYVPKIVINALSVPQFTSIGYSATMEGDGKVLKCTIKDPNRKLLGETIAGDKGFFLRFQVIEGNLTA